MDELTLLAEALTTPDQPADAVAATRHALQHAALNPAGPRRTRTHWATAGLGVTAVATATTISLVIAAPDSPNAPPAKGGRTILLAAATTALRAPQAATGTYWYVETLVGRHLLPPGATSGPGGTMTWKMWTRADGTTWVTEPTGRIRRIYSPSTGVHLRSGFTVAGEDLTLDGIRHLPTSPAALRLWITTREARDHRGKVPDSDFVYDLSRLISALPTSPAVRSAAYRVLAAIPSIRDLGPSSSGGERLEYSAREPTKIPKMTMVVDPANAKMTFTSTWSGQIGRMVSTSTVIVAEWTNTLS